jgi:hypothetical protein
MDSGNRAVCTLPHRGHSLRFSPRQGKRGSSGATIVTSGIGVRGYPTAAMLLEHTIAHRAPNGRRMTRASASCERAPRRSQVRQSFPPRRRTRCRQGPPGSCSYAIDCASRCCSSSPATGSCHRVARDRRAHDSPTSAAAAASRPPPEEHGLKTRSSWLWAQYRIGTDDGCVPASMKDPRADLAACKDVTPPALAGGATTAAPSLKA